MRDKRNYLDFVPVKNPSLPWSKDEEEIVTVDVTHRGLANKIAQIAFNRPKMSHIKLDRFGSFVWQEIDGEQNIYQILGKTVTAVDRKECFVPPVTGSLLWEKRNYTGTCD